MNPDQPSREQIEARLTALLLDELPAAEAELLRWNIEHDPELKKLHDQLKLTIGFVREAMKNPTDAPVEKETPLKMSAERRQKLLAHFKTERRPRELPWLKRLEIPSTSSLVIAAIVVLMICGLAAISIPNFVKARATSQANATINNLRQIDAAKNEWALENRKSKGVAVTEDDITPYIQLDSNGNIPTCPAGGTYVIGKVGEPAMAEIQGKLLTESSETVEFALKAPSPSAGAAQSVTRNPQQPMTPPPLAQIVLPKTEQSQSESSQEESAQVVGYVNVDLGKASLTPVQQEPKAAPVVVTGIPRAPVSASSQAEIGNGAILATANTSLSSMPAQVEGQTASTISGGTSTVPTLPPNSSPFANRLESVEGFISSTGEQAAKSSYGGGAGGGGGGGTGAVPSNAYANNKFGMSGQGSSGGTVSFGGAQNGFAGAVNSMRSAAPHLAPSDNFTITNAIAENQSTYYGSVDAAHREEEGSEQSDLIAREAQNANGAVENNGKVVAVTPIPGSAAPSVELENPPASMAPPPEQPRGQYQYQLANGDTDEAVAILQKKYDNEAGELYNMQSNVDQLRDRLSIHDFGQSAEPTPTITSEQMQNYNELLINDKAAYTKDENELTELQSLKATNPQALRNVLPTIGADDKLSDLLSQLRNNEQKYTTETNYIGAQNPNYQSTLSSNARLNEEIDDRVNGLMIAFQSKVLSEKAALDALDAQVQSAETNDQLEAVHGQPYWEAKRHLQDKLDLHKLLAAKLESEKADETIPKSALVEVINPARTAQSQNLWQRLTGQVESQTRIKVEPDVVSDISSFNSGSGENAPYDPYFLQTEVKSIQSDAVLGKAVDALKLDQAWSKPDDGEKLSREDAIALLKSRLDLQADGKTGQIEIGAKSDKSDEAVKIANAVADAYKQYRLEMHNKEMDAGIDLLQQDYAEEETKITEEERRVSELRAQLNISDASVSASQAANNEMIPPSLIDFQGADVSQVLEVYAQLTGRTLLRSGLPQGQIVLKNETPLTRSAAIQALQRALALQGIAVINVGDKFVKVVPASEAGTAAAAQTDKPLASPPANAPIPQPEIQTRDNAFSTFSLNVSDVSFKLAAASLGNGQMPNPDSIRSEEFINAFDYHDPEPLQGQPLSFTSERARDPFAQERDFLRFSIKAAAMGRQEGRALNLVLLLDTSGSMERADRVAIIREALRVLSAQLQPQDTVSVVTFARTARLWADGVPGGLAGVTLEKVGSITPEGGTNLEEAMRLAYETARRHFIAGGMNRVVLLTDGAANLGNVDPQMLTRKVESERRKGIALDCFGIGWEDYNDDMLEQLSSNGDGRYAFINSPDEVATEFAAKLAGALQVAAEDVKVQVEFNPDRVAAWRQIGYAKHQLTKEQFRDNSVAAGAIASREAGNAVYVIKTKPDGEGPIATVHVRYRVPGTQDNRERSWLVDYTGAAPALAQASPAIRLAATAAEFSEWLSDSPYAQNVTPDDLLNYLSGIPQVYGIDQHPKQLEWMIRQAKSVSGK